MKKHEIESAYQAKHKCIYCDYTSDRPRNVKRHIGRKHQVEVEDVLARHCIKKYLKPISTNDFQHRASVIVDNPLYITPPPPPSPVVEPELINNMLDKNDNGRDNVENYTTQVNVIYRDKVKGKHKKVNCRICHRVVGSNNVKKTYETT